jgi:hypothetical protein
LVDVQISAKHQSVGFNADDAGNGRYSRLRRKSSDIVQMNYCKTEAGESKEPDCSTKLSCHPFRSAIPRLFLPGVFDSSFAKNLAAAS